ncbi:DUF4190 domain-containing protein [Candidatus Poriferisodalis sp.]|uniref:DUF4190 domain-containing protein n=1 Tax=Candidatus Poriferisodalis sp. TaxID=3101277 RepID=UPI003B02366C
MNPATTDAEPAAQVRVDDATIRRLRAALSEYGEQCGAAIRLREILPADSRELRRSPRRLAALQRLDAARTGRVAVASVELNISEDELSPVQRGELEHARSRATASMVLGIIALVPFGFGILAILALFSVPIGHTSRGILGRYPLLKARYGWTRATVGLVLGWIAIGAWLLVWIAIAFFGLTIWSLFS